MIKLSIIAAAHRLHIVVAVVQIVVGHVAIVHAHKPCAVGGAYEGSTQPVISGLHILKRMASRQGHIVITKINQAKKLSYVGQAPVASD